MERRRNVLVVEDDPVVRNLLEIAFQKENLYTTSVPDGRSALEAINKHDFDLVFTDLRIPEVNGLQVLKHVKQVKPLTNVVVGTAYGSIETAVEAMRLGAADYLTKPFGMQDIQRLAKRILSFNRAQKGLANAEVERRIDSILVSESEIMAKIKLLVQKIAATDATVLIEGETGVGKEVVADAIHYSSPRSHKPFIKVNCAAVPDTLFESELFGYVKGAFTGANISRKGRFEQANGGTILLDEISEQGLAMQAKLLRVIQSKQIEPLGNGKPLEIDTRIIATSNRDLIEEVRQGRFRKDLYFRLNVFKIKVPPLRERKEDIPLLAQFFVKKFSKSYGLPKQISSQAIKRLMEHTWPGNVRELENTIEKAVLLNPNNIITADDLHFCENLDSPAEDAGSDGEMTLFDAEKRTILKTLARYDNNKTQAARALGITVKTLRNKLKVYQMEEEENSLN